MTWQQIPFVRFLLPFLFGILCYTTTEFALHTGLQLGLMVFIFCLLILSKDSKDQSIRQTRFWGAGLMILFFCLGFFVSQQQDVRQQEHYFAHYLEADHPILAKIESPPKLSAKSVKAELTVVACQNKHYQSIPAKGKLLAYIHLDSFSAQLKYGDQILLHGDIKPIEGPKNPAAFDLRSYYNSKQIYHQVYLAEQHWKVMARQQGNPFYQMVYSFKKRLLLLLQEHLDSPNEYAVAAALLLGSKDALNKDLRSAYADTGAMHVLAVSGLHVGILATILSFLLGLVGRKNKYWQPTRILLTIALLWLFALLTGASASVLRACTMFSFVLAGQAFQRKINIYNSLAASAFFLLCFNTALLYDIGFQLSYLALIGIVYLYPKIYRFWYIENRLGAWLWSGVALSLAAQIITVPISLYYFHQFPVFFWISGVVVTAAAAFILPIGLCLLIFNCIPILGLCLGYLLYGAIWLMNSLIFGIQQLPGATWEGFWLEYWQMGAWYFVLGASILFFIKKELKWAFLPIAGCLVLFLHRAQLIAQQHQQQELCIYNSRKNTIISYLNGSESYTICNQAAIGSPSLQFAQQNHLWSKGIHHNRFVSFQDSLQASNIYYQNKKGQVRQKRLLVYTQAEQQLRSHELLDVDYVLVHNNPKLKSVLDIEELCTFKTLIFDASNSAWKVKKWVEECRALGIDFINVLEDGAWVCSLKE